MMSKKVCPYHEEWLIFKGKENMGNIPINLYKNVFCLRGLKGWANCEKYISNHKNQTD